MSTGHQPLGSGLAATLGITAWELIGEDRARAEMPVSEVILQPFGIVHGGALATLAETLASRATYEHVGPDLGAFGQTNETTFLRAIRSGTITALGHARHRGRTTWVWDVEMTDENSRLCALSRVIIAIRPLKRD